MGERLITSEEARSFEFAGRGGRRVFGGPDSLVNGGPDKSENEGLVNRELGTSWICVCRAVVGRFVSG